MHSKIYQMLTFNTNGRGIFGEDFGEDYFGFKNIGLDQEYNLDMLNVRLQACYFRVY